MTGQIKDGGPAFPQSETLYEDGAMLSREQFGGMSLRDWFATHAPSMPPDWMDDEARAEQPPGWAEGMGAAEWKRLWQDFHVRRVALWRFYWADAMLAAREAKP